VSQGEALAEAEAPPADEFIERLEAIAESQYLHRHPFNLLMHAGRLEREDLRLWVANRYHYQTRIPIKDALILAKAESHSFRHLWMQRLLDHDGHDDPRQPGAAAAAGAAAAPAGLELWRRLGHALGLADAELESGAELLPEARAVCDASVERVRNADLLTAVAFSLTDYFAPRLMQRHIQAWLQYYPLLPAPALEHCEQRMLRAREDAAFALAFVCREATTAARRERCLRAFQNQCRMMWRLLDAVYIERRRRRVPRLDGRAWLMKLPSLAPPEQRAQAAVPGLLMLPERALSLSRTGYELLASCTGQLTLGQIAAQLAEHHGVAAETVERDSATFVAALEQRHWLAFDAEPDR
jgi:pyrroloquinoline-quinone synthase